MTSTTTTGVQTRARDERGQSLVEFAFVLPMLLVIVFAIIEFGVIMMDHIQIQNAATAGARAGSLKGSNSSNAVSAANSAAVGLVSCPVSTPTASYSGSPQQVTVTVSCPYSPITPLGSLAAAVDVASTISSTVLMRVEQ
jgi:Flp pilus assembly protein TadG